MTYDSELYAFAKSAKENTCKEAKKKKGLNKKHKNFAPFA